MTRLDLSVILGSAFMSSVHNISRSEETVTHSVRTSWMLSNGETLAQKHQYLSIS